QKGRARGLWSVAWSLPQLMAAREGPAACARFDFRAGNPCMTLSLGAGCRRAGLAVAHRVGFRSMQVVHVLGAREGGGAAGAVAARIGALGAPDRRAERRPRPRLGAPDRRRRRLPVELSTERL